MDSCFSQKGQNSPCNLKYVLIITFQLLMRKTLRHTVMYFRLTKRICSSVKLLVINLPSVIFCLNFTLIGSRTEDELLFLINTHQEMWPVKSDLYFLKTTYVLNTRDHFCPIFLFMLNIFLVYCINSLISPLVLNLRNDIDLLNIWTVADKWAIVPNEFLIMGSPSRRFAEVRLT